MDQPGPRGYLRPRETEAHLVTIAANPNAQDRIDVFALDESVGDRGVAPSAAAHSGNRSCHPESWPVAAFDDPIEEP